VQCHLVAFTSRLGVQCHLVSFTNRLGVQCHLQASFVCNVAYFVMCRAEIVMCFE